MMIDQFKIRTILRRWFQIAKDAYRTRPPEPAWRSVTCAIGTVLYLAALRAAAKVARIVGRPGLSASLIAKTDSVGRSGILLSPMSRVYPWFHLESFESGLACSDYPSIREGYSLRVWPLAKPLWFEFESDAVNSTLKLPLWATSRARARIEVLEMSDSGLLPIFQGVRTIPMESPDASLSIPLFWPSPEKLRRRFRVQIVPALLGHRGYLNFFATDHPAPLSLEAFPAEPVPSVSIVTLLYGKERECLEFARALHEQNYPGTIEVIAIDDDSPDNSSQALREAISRLQEEYPESAKRIRWSLSKNPINLGNCTSRNSGLSQVSGDLIFVMDCDCIPNRTFLWEHAHSHIRHKADVVIGLHNIESGFQPVSEVLELLEADYDSRTQRADLQDPINPVSFLNCVTRNFSFRKAYLSHIHFDEAFGYSRAKDSGFGWEDIELGYKLYLTGARMVFNPHAFTVHISHPPNSDPRDLPLRSEKNLDLLISKHPELSLIGRRWLTHTIKRLQHWRQAENLQPTEISEGLTDRIAKAPRILAPRKLRILTYRWHPAHQYEIYKTGHRFDLVRSSDERLTSFSRQWEYGQRPLPANAGFIELDQLNFADYDLALLHFDENVLDWQNTNNVLCKNWGASFRYFMEHIPLPKVAICHGTPQFHGMYTFGYEEQDLLNEIPETRQRLVDYLGNTLVICNSHQAKAEWNFKNSRVIWHGFDPTEFPESRRSKGILTLGRAMKERPYYRGYYFYEESLKGVPAEHHPRALKVEEPDFPNCRLGNEYARAKFRNYVDAIREYSIYFNPTLRSPMPRSRGEAMMCGLVSVSARNHDVDQYIVNGRNGFHAETPEEARDYLLYLINHQEACARMGHASRQTALDVFNHDRFMSEWQSIFTSLAR